MARCSHHVYNHAFTAMDEPDTKTENYDDWVAVIRTCIFVSYMVTNTFIVSGVVRHWNEVSGHLPKTEEKGVCHTEGNILQN